jgi:phosphoserine phosphatase
VGDTESDAPMLEIVENPIAFNPNFDLKQIAETKGWKIIVEKKDVIYDLSLGQNKSEQSIL